MGLFGFGNKKEGGIMDVIRCDETDYLMWKWSPNGERSHKENAIRYGSSLRVKAGEVAVLVYKQDNKMMDFIEGPFDQTIKTANFPVLTSLVGAAYGGESPFQAEVYFINLAGSIRLAFFVDRMKITDPRFPDNVVPVQVKGAITFCISDYRDFISKYRMRNYDMDELSLQIRDMVIRYVKEVVISAPHKFKIPALQIESGIDIISTQVEAKVKSALKDDFAVSMKRFDISEIYLDETSEGYKRLKDIGASQVDLMQTQYQTNMENMIVNSENMAETLRIQREETQRRQKLDTESTYLSAHQINVQGEVAGKAAESLGAMNANMSFGDGGGMNPAGMMTGMMMGGVVGGGMANMMGNVMNGMNQQQPPMPPVDAVIQYYVAINGQQSGPYNMAQLKQLVHTGQFTSNTYVWKQGMSGWELASKVPELIPLFGTVPPPVPPTL